MTDKKKITLVSFDKAGDLFCHPYSTPLTTQVPAFDFC